MCCHSLDWGDWLLQTGGCIIQVSASACEFFRSSLLLSNTGYIPCMMNSHTAHACTMVTSGNHGIIAMTTY